MDTFAEEYISSWDEFSKFVREQRPTEKWIYRGQVRDWDVDPKLATAIEFQTIREFRRRPA